MFRNRSVSIHQFSMIPRADIPRSSFNIQTTHKTTLDSSWVYPVYVDEVLPGDTFSLKMTAFARMSTPLFPIMDNLYLESFFFFVPYRLVWSNWKRFMGEQDNPSSSISYTVPQITPPATGYPVGSLGDHMGLPSVGSVGGGISWSHSALPFRAYTLIFNTWFRDENLMTSLAETFGDGPDTFGTYALFRRGKRHDYFTSCLPWVQKGTSVSLPLGTSAPVIPNVPGAFPTFDVGSIVGAALSNATSGSNTIWSNVPGATSTSARWNNPALRVDLSSATAATINQLRQSFQVQKLLERDARGGTRYTEIIRSHFGVVSPDSRLQRPEYLGGGSQPINISPIAQTSATGISGGTTPSGTLSGIGTVVAHNHGFSQSFTEHGVILGLVNIRADLTYQQGLRRMWSRKTRYDFYFPVFAALGEQAVLNKEIFCGGIASFDDAVFGYQERWAEYRYHPSMITGLFRSTAAGTLDGWHLAQHFATLPTLNESFIVDVPPMSRVLAVGAAADGQQFIFDSFFNIKAARPMPMYSVPGLVDHF